MIVKAIPALSIKIRIEVRLIALICIFFSPLNLTAMIRKAIELTIPSCQKKLLLIVKRSGQTWHIDSPLTVRCDTGRCQSPYPPCYMCRRLCTKPVRRTVQKPQKQKEAALKEYYLSPNQIKPNYLKPFRVIVLKSQLSCLFRSSFGCFNKSDAAKIHALCIIYNYKGQKKFHFFLETC